MIEQYVQAFKNKDRQAIAQLFSADIQFQDPSCGLIKGKENALKIYDGLFQNDILKVELKRQANLGETYFVEFSLQLKDPGGNKITVDGVDIIEIHQQQIKSIRAYLDTSTFIQK